MQTPYIYRVGTKKLNIEILEIFLMLLSFISTNVRIFASSPNKRAVKEEPIFEIAYLEEALNFLASLDSKVKSKITYNIGKSRYHIDKELFKKLENTEIWEFRTIYNKQSYRLFAFWDTDENKLVVATHGIVKKTQKTPKKEIEKAETIRKEYFKNK